MTKTEFEYSIKRDMFLCEKMNKLFICHGPSGSYYITYSHPDGSGRYQLSWDDWFWQLFRWGREQEWWDDFTVLKLGGIIGMISQEILNSKTFASDLYQYLEWKDTTI